MDFVMQGAREVVSVLIASLRSHPRQKDFFSDTSESELDELAIDLSQRGQQEPIHICPDGTILRGHRRVKAAGRLGWESILAIVRHDLVDANSPAAIRDLIDDNVMRRQLGELELARCYREMKASHDPAFGTDRGDRRDRLAARLKSGKSGRTLDRLERLLLLPRDIQDMISANTINKHQGEKILRLTKQKQEALFAELRANNRVTDVLRRHGVIAAVSRKTPAQVGEELLNFFRANLKIIRRDINALDRLQVRGGDVVTLLDEATRVLSAWADRKRSLRQQALDSMDLIVESRQQPDKLSN